MSDDEKRLSALGSVDPTPMEASPSASDRQLYNEQPADAKEAPTGDPKPTPPARSSRWKLFAALGCLAVVILVLVIVLPVYFLVIKKRNTSTGGHGGSGGGGAVNGDDTLPVAQPDGATSGGDGSKVYTEDGSSFTYTNKFGGHWSYDPARPFANEARAQSYTPALNETWKWGQDTIKGVNLGGWLVTEPFITPALYQKYSSMTYPNGSYQIIDEWKLVEQMKADGSIGDLEKHYATFYTEKDFADIVAAGLNWVRLPIPFWAVETVGNEPYIESVQWKYVLKAIGWARKYGLRINLDLHTHPGSQNGWNHSGLNNGPLGVNWLNGVMGIANAQRSLDYIRIITQFISQPEYAPVVPYFGIVNEPRIMAGNHVLQPEVVQSFYFEAYKQIRNVTGIGEGKGPMIGIHDGFLGFSEWNTFLTGADRLSIDTHPYFAFDGPNDAPLESFIPRPCSRWGDAINVTQSTFGVITAGEISAAVNDCGLFVTGVGTPTRYQGDCDPWMKWENWDQTTKDSLRQFALSSMDALQNWFFWTWKIGPSATDNSVRAPFWSYKLGLDNGWLPTDPRDAVGACVRQGQSGTPFNGQHPAWATGGAGAGEIQAAATATLTWPPTSLGPSYPVALYLPTYTPTGTHTTLAVPRITAHGVSPGDGWFNDNDQAPLMVPIQSCSYPEAYGGALMPQPTVPFCGNTEVVAMPTPVAVLTADGSGLPFTTTVLEYSAVPGEVTVPFDTSSSTTVAAKRRYAPRGGMPMPTLA
ncbi:Probable glucan 1,3-beta-glucosidase D; AltName: Full=Exo-1,3-beta-glucanase D [Serendipita indica DSM 11827]|nr:Probable glucan 1,3-beta-glucosidase D; AltName: Full=Exo-1,3-beta-glucanase D [Serendipita indica DSM 11827]